MSGGGIVPGPGGGGGGASIPAAASAVLLDAGAPSTIVGLNGSGVGAALTGAQAQAILTPTVPVSLAVSTGWTTDANGTATAVINTGASTIDLTVPAGGNYARAGHAPWTNERMDLRTRVVTLSGGGTSADFVQMAVGDALGASAYMLVRIRDNDTAVVEVDGPTVSTATAVIAGLSGGQGWFRLVVDGLTARAYVGVGSAGAEPTSWTAAGVMVRTGTTARVPWAFVIFQVNRGGAGTVTAVLSTIVYTVLQ